MADFVSYSNRFDQTVVNVMQNKYVSGFITLFCILYISLARPALPDYIHSLFDNKLFRFLVLVMTAYIATMNLRVALIVTIAFIVTLNLLNEQKIAEGFISGISRNTIERFDNEDDKEIKSLETDTTDDSNQTENQGSS